MTEINLIGEIMLWSVVCIGSLFFLIYAICQATEGEIVHLQIFLAGVIIVGLTLFAL